MKTETKTQTKWVIRRNKGLYLYAVVGGPDTFDLENATLYDTFYKARLNTQDEEYVDKVKLTKTITREVVRGDRFMKRHYSTEYML